MPALNERFNLVRSFLAASLLVVAIGMGIIGIWVTNRIEKTISENAATVAALYVDGVVAPLIQSLTNRPQIDAQTRALLDEKLNRGLMNRELHAFKIWLPDGTIVYASNADLIGQKFAITEGLARAAAGRVHTEFDDLSDPESADERSHNIPLLEVYSPVRSSDSGSVIGVIEFYDRATELGAELQRARRESWLVVGATTIAMLGLLSGIIVRGGRLIAQQRAVLHQQVADLSAVLSQNEALRQRADQANRKAAALNEQHLRRTSAEIHDGPLQHLAYASLRLTATSQPSQDERQSIQQALGQTMRELRLISAGLTLPELDGLSASEIVSRAVRAHQGRTGHTVDVECAGDITHLPKTESMCLYRFIQEGLNNASKHAGGQGLRVKLAVEAEQLVARVFDSGRGFDPDLSSHGLGLSGMRERLGGLGGTLLVTSTPETGTVLTATLPIKQIQ